MSWLGSKKKKRLVKVTITHHALDTRCEDSVTEIIVPEGCKFVRNHSWDDAKLVDKDGDVLGVWDLQAGFSHQYVYTYEEEV